MTLHVRASAKLSSAFSSPSRTTPIDGGITARLRTPAEEQQNSR
jgi:hypothetical protein